MDSALSWHCDLGPLWSLTDSPRSLAGSAEQQAAHHPEIHLKTSVSVSLGSGAQSPRLHPDPGSTMQNCLSSLCNWQMIQELL